jgi:hypothetical protein
MVALAAIVTPRLAAAVLPLTSDQGLFITIGEILKKGGVVGRDSWDTKPPGIYYLYAGLLEIAPDYSATCRVSLPLRPLVEHEVPCAQLVLSVFDVLYALSLSASVWWLGRRLYGPAAGILAGVLCAFYGSMLQLTGGGGIADLYVLLPSTLAYAAAALYAERQGLRLLVIAGALGGVAVLVKQTGAVLLAGVAVWVLVCRARQRGSSGWRSVMSGWAAMAIGAGGVLVVCGVLLTTTGALQDVVNQALVFNLYYVSQPASVNSFPAQLAAQSWSVFDGSQSGLWVAGVLGLCLLVGRSLLSLGDGSLLVLAWLISSAITVVAAGAQLHVNYYLALVPPLSILGGYALARLWDTRRIVVRAALSVAATMLVLHSGQFQNHQYGNAWYSRIQSNTHSTEEFVAGAVGNEPGSLFIWGNAPQVYALTGRPPASRYLHTIGLSYDYAFHTEVQQNRAELIATLEQSPPRVVAIDTPWLRRARTLPFPELDAFLERGYALANDAANPIYDGWRIYRRVS